MQKIKVAKVESKPTSKGGTMVAVFDDKNTRFSGFLKELQDVKAGDVIEAEIQVDGKYNNIISMKILEHGTAPTPATPAADNTNSRMSSEQWAEKDRIERRSIERQVSAKIAASTFEPGKFDDTTFKARANTIYSWIANQIADTPAKSEPTTKPDPIQQPPKPKSDADPDWDKLKSGSERNNPATADERLDKIMKDMGYNAGQIKTHIYAKYGVTDWKRLNAAQYNELLLDIQNEQVARK